jgi:hypothetical protein
MLDELKEINGAEKISAAPRLANEALGVCFSSGFAAIAVLNHRL